MRTLLHLGWSDASSPLLSCGEPGPADETDEARHTAALSDSPSLTASLHAACPTDMVAVAGFCMDRYEAPNQPGVAPLPCRPPRTPPTSAPLARSACAPRPSGCAPAKARPKLPYPYGTSYQRSRCNDDKVWKVPSWSTLATWPSAAAQAEAKRLYQADPSGRRAGCVSAEGVVDLTGNVAEWVVRSFPNAKNYDHVMKGCYWSGCYGGSPPSCSFVNPAHPGTFRTYEAGFRCCLTPS